MNVIVCTGLSGKDSHRQVDMDVVGLSGNLGGVIVSTLDRNAKGSTLLGHNISHFHHPTTLVVNHIRVNKIHFKQVT